MEDSKVKSDDAVSQDLQPTSGQPRHERINSDETERPPSEQRIREGSTQHSDVESEQSASSDEEADPSVEIEHYDWEDLHQQYHDAIKKCNLEENDLMKEWASLMEVLHRLTKTL